MDDLIEHRNFNNFEIVFEEVLSNFSSFKQMFLETRNYLLNNHMIVSFNFDYDNLYIYC